VPTKFRGSGSETARRLLSGVYWGDRGDELGMEIEVNVKSEDSLHSAEITAPRIVRGGTRNKKTADAID
jgi:hypothetical protein